MLATLPASPAFLPTTDDHGQPGGLRLRHSTINTHPKRKPASILLLHVHTPSAAPRSSSSLPPWRSRKRLAFFCRMRSFLLRFAAGAPFTVAPAEETATSHAWNVMPSSLMPRLLWLHKVAVQQTVHYVPAGPAAGLRRACSSIMSSSSSAFRRSSAAFSSADGSSTPFLLFFFCFFASPNSDVS